MDAILETANVEIVTTCLRSPNMNAYAERAIQTVQTGCLDHFIILGEYHLSYLVTEFLEYYHLERPHQGKGNVPLTASATGSLDQPDSSSSSDAPLRLKDIARRERLGGLLKHYYRNAA